MTTIYGASQSTGVERQLNLEKGIDGVILTILDHKGQKEQGRISVLPTALMDALTSGTQGSSALQGLRSSHGTLSQIQVEVRRNEVWLSMSNDSGEGGDIAVGFDDLQDALEGVIGRA